MVKDSADSIIIKCPKNYILYHIFYIYTEHIFLSAAVSGFWFSPKNFYGL